jgi:hypothetical protein
VAKTYLERFLEQERPELLPTFARYRAFAEREDIFGQAVVFGITDIAHELLSMSTTDDYKEELEGFSAFVGQFADGYEMGDAPPDWNILPAAFTATLNGLIEDIHDDGLRLDALRASLQHLLQGLSRHNAHAYGEAQTQLVIVCYAQEGLDVDLIGFPSLLLVTGRDCSGWSNAKCAEALFLFPVAASRFLETSRSSSPTCFASLVTSLA